MSSPYTPANYSNANSFVTTSAVSQITNQLFGPPSQHATGQALYDNYASAVHDITEFANVPTVTGRIIEGLVNNMPLGIFGILPLRKTNTLLNTASIMSFEREPLGRVPPRGGFRTLQSSKRSVVGRMTRYGAAIENDATAVLTPDGERMNDLKFIQVQLATQNTMLMDVLYTLSNAGVEMPFDASDRTLRDFRIYARAEAERTFAFQKNPQTWTGLINRAYSELVTARNGAGAHALVVPFDFIDAMASDQRMLGKDEGYDAGAEVLNRRPGDLSGPIMVFRNGVRVYAAPPLHTYEQTTGANSIDEAMYNSLQRQIYISEHVPGYNADEVDEFSDGTPGSDKPRYRSSHSDVVVYNRDTDEFAKIKRIDQLRYAGITELPFLINPNEKLGGSYEYHYPAPGSGVARLPFYYAWENRPRDASGRDTTPIGTYEATHLLDLDSSAMNFSHVMKMAQTMLATGFVGFDPDDGSNITGGVWVPEETAEINRLNEVEREREEQGETEATQTSTGKRRATQMSTMRERFQKRTRTVEASRRRTGPLRTESSNAQYWMAYVERYSATNPLLNFALRRALEFPIGNWDAIENAVRNNIYLPFKVLMLWPRIAFQADSAILAKMGPETGETLWAFPALTSGTDPSNQSTLSSFSIWFDVMVYQPKYIINMQNYMCRMYEFGGGVVPFKRGSVAEQMAADHKSPLDRPSVIFYALCPSEEIPEMISPAGYWTNTVAAAAAGGVHLSAAWIERDHGYNLKDESASFDPRAKFDRDVPPSPLVSFTGMHAYVNVNGGIVVKQAKGVCGPNASGPGSRAVYDRVVPFFPKPDEHLALLERQVRNSGLLVETRG